ncbi:Gamma-L-glutamyl-butirosin B gamma-glutamyl cyclotransferase [Rubripirellula obstinata]|uniref:Gamma-L-glutamyl-butirosin B gamma-glutamyl cyclotransferase n=1 Tax=Rubripirellula obstinata TaxID=406547 RepID=A0A5B1CDR3_9BACT|nr:gamma-glutamylcyclotransferase family protein [Rubripirellula obstinata]KAA1259258.1 Gamma-L-glutamyl-butirosin B gamma-glutamyl cyclotransferase [Rubripirellula obstinata]
MNPNRFFVYGTLCRGNCRSKMWPHSPVSIQSAWVAGSLYDGPGYPAMRQGDEKVQGEVWTFRDEHVPEVTRVLDGIEGTNQPGVPNLYDRIVIETFKVAFRSAKDASAATFPKREATIVDLSNQSLGTAWTYHYATDPTLHGFTRIKPTDDAGMVYWLERSA